jgi:nucleotide-binding universal stress UspA family protein
MSGRVVVGFAPTLAGYEALRYGVAQASGRSAKLVIVRAVRLKPYETSIADRVPMTVAVTMQVATAFQEALGALPIHLDVHVVVNTGLSDMVLTAVANQPDDLLVLGACTRGRLGALTHTAMLRRTLHSAVCPLVVIPPPAMSRLGSATRLGKNAVAELERYLQHPVGLAS